MIGRWRRCGSCTIRRRPVAPIHGRARAAHGLRQPDAARDGRRRGSRGPHPRRAMDRSAGHPGAFIVNIGDCLMRWTNDVYVSTPHRVVNRSPRSAIRSPFSTTRIRTRWSRRFRAAYEKGNSPVIRRFSGCRLSEDALWTQASRRRPSGLASNLLPAVGAPALPTRRGRVRAQGGLALYTILDSE